MAHTLIEFKNVDLGYGRKKVLSDLSFSVNHGDLIGIVGPNGSGKTTIVRAILGILKAQNGEIVFHPTQDEKLRVGYVPQRDTIDQIMPFTVYDVVMMGRYGRISFYKLPSKEDKAKVQEALAHVDVEDLSQRSFKDLSGGQKQRALIARALAANPDILVLDEPTNGMDLTSRTAMLELIKKLHREDHLTVIMVSHLLSDVANYVQKIILVENGYFAVGSVEEILTEQKLTEIYGLPVHVGEFLNSKVIIAGGKSV
ncbi:MAG: metal ABC transporter ATP-binding protein [Ignavibacteriales bacterium]|nr:metal ABC transporter ATP-binding protein [Ignavibacteriales bacterium]